MISTRRGQVSPQVSSRTPRGVSPRAKVSFSCQSFFGAFLFRTLIVQDLGPNPSKRFQKSSPQKLGKLARASSSSTRANSRSCTPVTGSGRPARVTSTNLPLLGPDLRTARLPTFQRRGLSSEGAGRGSGSSSFSSSSPASFCLGLPRAGAPCSEEPDPGAVWETSPSAPSSLEGVGGTSEEASF